MGYLTPERTTPARPIGTAGETLEVRSYLLMRVVIGLLGISLPIVLILGNLFFLDTGFSKRGSLSAYYHSGMRDIFVGALVVAGFFLITYKIFRKSLENTLSIIAGIAALGVALFPTNIPAGIVSPMTPLQERLGEDSVTTIHFVSAVAFIVLLAVICYFFSVRENGRSQQRGAQRARFSPKFWQRFHLTAAGTIVAAILFILITMAAGVLEDYRLLIGETVAVWAFAVSWLAKGLELDILRGVAQTSPRFDE